MLCPNANNAADPDQIPPSVPSLPKLYYLNLSHTNSVKPKHTQGSTETKLWRGYRSVPYVRMHVRSFVCSPCHHSNELIYYPISI